LIRFIYIYLFLVLTYSVNALPVHIFGNSVDYAGMKINVYKYSDLITHLEQEIATIHIDDSGNFSTNINIDFTQEICMYLGLFKTYMFVEPGKEYEIALPPRQDKTMEEELNPFFEEEKISLGIKNADSTELNYLIFNFNIEYESFIQEYFSWLYITANVNVIDSVVNLLDSSFNYSKNEYFNTYKQYKYASLYHFGYERDINFVTRKYLLNKEFYYYNKAYMELFNNAWSGYVNEFKTEEHELYRAIVFGKSPMMVKNIFEKNIALRNDQLKELVLLKCLDEAFLLDFEFPYRTLNQTLDSIILSSNYSEHIGIAKNIKQKYDKLRVGNMAPELSLINVNRDTINLKSFGEKYIYLIFCRSENFACLKDYRLLTNIYEKFSDNLEIVVVSYDSDFQTFTEYVKTNTHYNWTFLYANSNKDILTKYNIKIMPSYFLLDPLGKIIMLPAATPHENFIDYFSQIVNWRKRVRELEDYNQGDFFKKNTPNNNKQ
jgi:peroxiredoxin